MWVCWLHSRLCYWGGRGMLTAEILRAQDIVQLLRYNRWPLQLARWAAERP